MYLFQNALKNLLRNKGRYFLVGGVITVMLIAVTVSAMINSITKEIISDYVERFNARVYFSLNMKKLFEQASDPNGLVNAPEMSTEQLLSFADSEYVAKTLLRGFFHAYGDSFQGLDQGGQEKGSPLNFTPTNPDVLDEINKRQIPNVVVLGYHDLDFMWRVPVSDSILSDQLKIAESS